MTTMNDAQTIFTVFYAIFWGAVFSVSSRWKPFNFGLIFDKEVKHVARRISLAKLILNILPIIYFVLIYYILGLKGNLCSQQKTYWVEFSAMVLSGIIPGFGIFGFYRLYIGIVEFDPTKYYKYRCEIPMRYRAYCSKDNDPEPSIQKLGIILSHKHTWRNNMIFGGVYIILSGSGSLLPDTIFAFVIILCIGCLLCKGNYLIVIMVTVISLIILLYLLSYYEGIDIVYHWLRYYFPQAPPQPFGEMAKVGIISLAVA